MSDKPEPIASVLAEMREAGRSDEHADGPLIDDYADRVEEAVRYQFGKIWHFCQAEINSAISDHISSIFMLKVVRDVAQDQLSSLSPTETEAANE